MAIDIEFFYRRHGPMVLRRCRKLLRNEDKAADAMHDVFVELVRRQHRLHDAAPVSLLLRIATNVCLNRLRSERRRPEDADDELVMRIAGAEQSAEGQVEARSFLGRIFSRERESTRVMAVMHLVDGMSLEEVAAEVNLSISGVRKRLRVLRARVAEMEGV